MIAGTARGRRLVSPAGAAVRPTSDRVRESIFNMVLSRFPLEGAHVGDLFAGTGAMGIEALSRGAAGATFVDHDRQAITIVRANLEATGVEGATVVHGDVLRFLAGRSGGQIRPHRERSAHHKGEGDERGAGEGGGVGAESAESGGGAQSGGGGGGAVGFGSQKPRPSAAFGSQNHGAGRFDVAFVDPPYAFDRWAELFSLLSAGLVVTESDREVVPGAGWENVKVRRYGGTVVTLVVPAGDRP